MNKILITLLTIFLASSLFAKEKDVFTKVTTPIFLDSKGTIQKGNVDVSTPLKLLETKDAFVKVKLIGWSAEGSETVVFKQMGQRIIYALLDETLISKLKILETKLDYYETTWKKVSLEFWISKENIVSDMNIVLNEGKALYDGRCGACHATPDLHHFTSNQWPGIIGSMKDRAGLSKTELQVVIKYVQNNSK